MARTPAKFRLEKKALQWLREAPPDADEEPHDNALAAWVLRKMSAGEILDMRGILVDRALLGATFACVPQRCSPAAARGRYRSCCADLRVPLSPRERGRLLCRRKRLAEHLGRSETALRGNGSRGASYWLEEGGAALARPDSRCAFSTIEPDGRIRCSLHSFAKAEGRAPSSLQPMSCTLFPLVLFELTSGKLLLSLLQKGNHKLLAALPPQRFPCLTDPGLPPLLESMGSTLDRLFGRGFARAVRSSKPSEQANVYDRNSAVNP